MAAVAERIEADTTPREVQITYEWLLAQDTARRERAVPDSARFVATLTPIEDFSDSGRIQAFCDTLLNAPRPVRIAFLGDSFVEGDILTADLRERLQSAYSGGGAGFAPMASPLTAFRRTVKTQSKGWTTYNIMQRKAAPARLRENFYVSGWVSQPAAGASTRWESTDYRKRLDSCTTARVFFLSPRDSRVEVTLNDAQRREFDIAGDDAVRQIAVSAPRVRSLAFKVLSGAEDFVGYGAVFEGRGVVVDNYSVRSNNGQAMFWTNPSVNAQINAMLGYDLVVLQYGLNIMQPGVKNYTNYAGQIEKMIAYVRRIRTDGRHPTHARLPAPCGAEHGRGLLAHVRRHARPGRHGTVRQERLGGQGLHPHQLRRRAPRGMGAVRRHQRRSLGSLHRAADRQPAPHGGAGRPRLGAQGRRRPQHPPGPILRTP